MEDKKVRLEEAKHIPIFKAKLKNSFNFFAQK